MVSRGEPVAHQLPGGSGNLPCSKMLCQRQEKCYCVIEVGQHDSSDLHIQTGRDSVPQTQPYSLRTVVCGA